MEFMAWFIHKYVMHGILWNLHRDHHQKDHDHWWERNDVFFLFYGLLSAALIILPDPEVYWACAPIGIGIAAYGTVYFIVHDIFIHQRIKWLRNIDNSYARGVRRAHKIHHKNRHRKDSENFGMLVVPMKYFRK
ncbi:MAG: sterol desaturase family protein [Bacteroidota bacterium]